MIPVPCMSCQVPFMSVSLLMHRNLNMSQDQKSSYFCTLMKTSETHFYPGATGALCQVGHMLSLTQQSATKGGAPTAHLTDQGPLPGSGGGRGSSDHTDWGRAFPCSWSHQQERGGWCPFPRRPITLTKKQPTLLLEVPPACHLNRQRGVTGSAHAPSCTYHATP